MLPTTLPANTGDGVIVFTSILGFIVVLVVIGALIWLGRELFEWRRRRPAALADLERRYVAGEIDRAEFYVRRADLLPPDSPARNEAAAAVPPPPAPPGALPPQ